ncbi:hypothetical protein KDJ56_15295 [Brevibacillus composti]|uniref:Uncharacterized protein n=1 Tax=Brevibacillus composti TaxID=2796470 RepID=A0A7T5JME8_9BACL|nr:hypothetical protein [Brevibacillus composti]QQE73273.1 hypothetical protein JD108_15350 [Brevibacillus composti]QUO40354.1 hypothetical protein KDJ56_15295 [Brevibacillus composti]
MAKRKAARPFLLLLAIVCLFLSSTNPSEAAKQQADEIAISVRVSPASSHVSRLTVRPAKSLIRSILKSPEAPAGAPPHPVRATVEIKGTRYFLGYDGAFHDPAHRKNIRLPAATYRQLDQHVTLLESSHYGKQLPWDEVRQHFRRMSHATVIDLETGEQFRVQRRAGSRHADVQPLTREDTRTMKQIYQGKWSWKRRAILVYINGTHYAASMHGMPHGAGAIQGNQFPGHFCIHFQGSSTHRKTEPDPSHSLMILKASGKLYETINAALPEQLADYFLTSLHEHDHYALSLTTASESLPATLTGIQSIKRSNPYEQHEAEPLLEIELAVRVDYLDQRGREHKDTWAFTIARLSPCDPWKIVEVLPESHKRLSRG